MPVHLLHRKLEYITHLNSLLNYLLLKNSNGVKILPFQSDYY